MIYIHSYNNPGLIVDIAQGESVRSSHSYNNPGLIVDIAQGESVRSSFSSHHFHFLYKCNSSRDYIAKTG